MLENLQKNREFQMLALDHYGSIVDRVGEKNLLELKEDILATLGVKASAVLLDTEYGLPAYKKINISTPLILKADPRENLLEPALTPHKAKALGASALKLLAKKPRTQKELVCSLASKSRGENLPFILEIVMPYETLEITLTTILTWRIQVSIYKLPYPGSPENCRKITHLLGNTPWVMLSGGKDFETFLTNYQIAKQNGASGFLAGRSLWQEALTIPAKTRKQFIVENSVPRWEQLTS